MAQSLKEKISQQAFFSWKMSQEIIANTAYDEKISSIIDEIKDTGNPKIMEAITHLSKIKDELAIECSQHVSENLKHKFSTGNTDFEFRNIKKGQTLDDVVENLKNTLIEITDSNKWEVQNLPIGELFNDLDDVLYVFWKENIDTTDLTFFNCVLRKPLNKERDIQIQIAFCDSNMLITYMYVRGKEYKFNKNEDLENLYTDQFLYYYIRNSLNSLLNIREC